MNNYREKEFVGAMKALVWASPHEVLRAIYDTVYESDSHIGKDIISLCDVANMMDIEIERPNGF